MRYFLKLIGFNAALTLFFLLAFSLNAKAAFTIGDHPDGNTSIGEGLQFYEDKSSALSLDDILTANVPWQINSEDVFSQGYSNSPFWLKFEIENLGVTERYLLEVGYPVLDHLDIYIEHDKQPISSFIMGDKVQFHERPIEHRLFLVPIEIKSGQTQTIYIRVKSTSSLQAPIVIWERSAFHESEIGMNLIHGIYIGGMLVIGIYNFLVFLALRAKSYFYYVCYVFSMLLFLAGLNGWTFKYLWPQSIHWNDTALLLFLNTTLLFGILFARHFLALKDLGKGLNRQANFLVTLSTLSILACFWVSYNIGIKVAIPYAAIVCIWVLFSGVYAWLRGQQSAGIYVASWAGILVGGVLLALNKLQIIPKNIFTDQAVQLGSLLEVMLLSFALAQRINHERSQRIDAQQRALAVQTHANEQLEANVVARTYELELANEKLKELSDTDQLTGLKNRRYLDHVLLLEFNRACRYQYPLSILLIDIDNFKVINDTYGHLVGDICIKEVADRFTQQLRIPSDKSARYGGEEFCAILPETNLEGALMLSERIRKSINDQKIEATEQGFSERISVSIGVFSKLPTSSDTVASFLDYADKALYDAKRKGRNRVEFFSIEDEPK